MTTSRWLVRTILACCLGALGYPAAAQEPPARKPIEVRIIEVLHGNRVITDAQRDELLRYAEEMRREEEREAAAESRIGERLDDLLEDIASRAVATTHRPGRGFRLRTADEDFSLAIALRLQIRFTHAMWRSNPRTDDENETDFAVEQARVYLTGHAFTKDLRFELSADFAGDHADTEVEFLNIVSNVSSDNLLAEMKDAFVEYAPCREFRVRAGQFRVPYSRQMLTSSGRLQFVDRSIVAREFAPGRELGVMVHGRALGDDDDLIAFAAGLFDGEGENRPNDDQGVLFAGRIAINPFGDPGDPESDLRKSGDFRLSAGLNAWLHQDDDHDGEGDDWSIGADLTARWRGVSLTAEVHRLRRDRGGADDPVAVGWFVQCGVMVIPRTLEIGARTAHISFHDNDPGNAAAREHLLVVNWFIEEDDVKLQTDFGWVEDHEGDHEDNREAWRLRMQLQLSF